MPTLYVCKNGKLVPRDPQKTHLSEPTVIKYKHIIRDISDSQCKCKQEIHGIKMKFQNQLNERDKEIQILISRIASKQTQIQKLETQIKSYKTSSTPIKQTLTKNLQINGFDSIFNDKFDKTLNSTVVSNFSICDFTQCQNIFTTRSQLQIKKTQKQMQQCFKKTNNLMNQIQGLMKKKRTYQFHNPIYVENSIIEQLENSSDKSLEQTHQDISMEDTFYLPENAYTEYDSMDMTTNYESDHNFVTNTLQSNDQQFYQKILNDAIILKHTIHQMKEQSQKQMKQLEQYYQQKLKISYEELQKQKEKNRLIEMTKNKLNEISDKGRKALAQLDQDENFNWDVGQNAKKLNKNKMRLSMTPKTIKS